MPLSPLNKFALLTLGGLFCAGQYLGNPHWSKAFILVLEHNTTRAVFTEVHKDQPRPIKATITVKGTAYTFESRFPLAELPAPSGQGQAYYYPNNPSIASLLAPWDNLYEETQAVGWWGLLFPVIFSLQYLRFHQQQGAHYNRQRFQYLLPKKSRLVRLSKHIGWRQAPHQRFRGQRHF